MSYVTKLRSGQKVKVSASLVKRPGLIQTGSGGWCTKKGCSCEQSSTALTSRQAGSALDFRPFSCSVYVQSVIPGSEVSS